MVGPKVYHIKNTRNYTGSTEVPVKIFNQLNDWFNHKEFHVKRMNEQFSRGHKKGIHVNFVPKFKLHVYTGVSGSINVAIEYYAKIKIGTAVVVGVLTSGISTVVGVGTLAYTLSEADEFVEEFWKYVDSLARTNYVVVGIERWKSDGKGGMVLITDPVKYAPPTYAQPPTQHQPPTYAQPSSLPQQYHQHPPQHYQPQPSYASPTPQQYQPQQPPYTSPTPQHYQPQHYAPHPQQYNQQHYPGGQYAPPQQYQPQPYSSSEQGPPLPPKPTKKKDLNESLEIEGGPNSPQPTAHHPQYQPQMYYPPPTPSPHPPYAPPSSAANNNNANLQAQQAGFNMSGGLYPAVQPNNQQNTYQPNNQYK